MQAKAWQRGLIVFRLKYGVQVRKWRHILSEVNTDFWNQINQISWIWSIKSLTENLKQPHMQLAHADVSCIMVELLFLLLSARCIQTVSSQIEHLQLRVPQTTPFFCNNLKVFSHSTYRWFGSWLKCFDSNAILKYCIHASSYWESHHHIFQECTSFYDKNTMHKVFLWPSFLQLFRFISPSF